MRYASPAARRIMSKECFKTARDCIGELYPGISLFAITRGQISMIDAILACLDQTGPAKISVWTWTIAEYEIECFTRLMIDKRVTGGILVIDGGARRKNTGLIRQWKSNYGADSVRYVRNHAKIATIESSHYCLLLRGSMNLNMNPRFEQFDLTEGGDDFYLVRDIENELLDLPDDTDGKSIYNASKVNDAFTADQLSFFEGIRTWRK